MLRPVILALSRSRTAERVATSFPGFSAFSRRFVAGNTRGDVIAAVRKLNTAGYDATVSFLGEAVSTPQEVDAAMAEFTAFASAVHDLGLRSHLSIKLTELGLSFDRDLAARSLDALARHAAACGTFVRIDMEDSRYTQVTLDTFREARRTHANIGVVVQAYLLRSADDIAALAAEGAPVRLVKGAYREPESVAYQDKSDVDAAFVRLAERYLSAMTGDAWLAIATHDARMVRAAIAAATRANVPRDRFEFQMLYGIRGDLQRQLRDEGYRVRVYVPYGSHWYPYMMRRLAERPANLWFFLRSAFRR
jgi:proline dehydrogenase